MKKGKIKKYQTGGGLTDLMGFLPMLGMMFNGNGQDPTSNGQSGFMGSLGYLSGKEKIVDQSHELLMQSTSKPYAGFQQGGELDEYTKIEKALEEFRKNRKRNPVYPKPSLNDVVANKLGYVPVDSESSDGQSGGSKTKGVDKFWEKQRGGAVDYKNAANKALDVLDIPQKKLMKILFGKEQSPSELMTGNEMGSKLMGKENYGLLADLIVDPLNFIPASKPFKGINLKKDLKKFNRIEKAKKIGRTLNAVDKIDDVVDIYESKYGELKEFLNSKQKGGGVEKRQGDPSLLKIYDALNLIDENGSSTYRHSSEDSASRFISKEIARSLRADKNPEKTKKIMKAVSDVGIDKKIINAGISKTQTDQYMKEVNKIGKPSLSNALEYKNLYNAIKKQTGITSSDAKKVATELIKDKGYIQRKLIETTVFPYLQNGGMINSTGYTPGTKSMGNPMNIIPSNNITMKNTPFPVLGIPNKGVPKIMQPGMDYMFGGATHVTEIPMRMRGGLIRKYQQGGPVELSPIQTEKGEMLIWPTGDITNVKATKLHKNMDKNHVTDLVPGGQGVYVASNFKPLTVKKDEVNFGMGIGRVEYDENMNRKVQPKEVQFNTLFGNSKKLTPAEIAKRIQSTFPTTDREDTFATRASGENKQSRAPYLEILQTVNDYKRDGGTPQFKQGGYIPRFQEGGGGMDLIGGILNGLNNIIGGIQQKDEARNLRMRTENDAADYEKYALDNINKGTALGMGAAMGSALSQDPYVNRPDRSLQEATMRDMNDKVPSYVRNATANQINRPLSIMKDAAFKNSSNFGRSSGALQNAYSQTLNSQSQAALQYGNQDVGLRNQYLSNIGNLKGQMAQEFSNQQNQIRTNRNTIFGNLFGNVGNLGMNKYNQDSAAKANALNIKMSARGMAQIATQNANQNMANGLAMIDWSGIGNQFSGSNTDSHGNNLNINVNSNGNGGGYYNQGYNPSQNSNQTYQSPCPGGCWPDAKGNCPC